MRLGASPLGATPLGGGGQTLSLPANAQAGIQNAGVLLGFSCDATTAAGGAIAGGVTLGFSCDATILVGSGGLQNPPPTPWIPDVGIEGTWIPDNPVISK